MNNYDNSSDLQGEMHSSVFPLFFVLLSLCKTFVVVRFWGYIGLNNLGWNFHPKTFLRMKFLINIYLFLLLSIGRVACAQRFSETVLDRGSGVTALCLGSSVLYFYKQTITVIMSPNSMKYKIVSRYKNTFTTYDHLNKCYDFWIIGKFEVQRIWIAKNGLMNRVIYLKSV